MFNTNIKKWLKSGLGSRKTHSELLLSKDTDNISDRTICNKMDTIWVQVIEIILYCEIIHKSLIL